MNPTPYKIIDYQPKTTDNSDHEDLVLLIAVGVLALVFLLCFLCLIIKCRKRCNKKHTYVEKPYENSCKIEKRWSSKHDALFDNEKLKLPSYVGIPMEQNQYQHSVSSPRSQSHTQSLLQTPPYCNNQLRLHTLSSPSLTPVKHVSVNSCSAHQLYSRKDKNLINQVNNLKVEKAVKYDGHHRQSEGNVVNMYNPEDDEGQKPAKRSSIALFRAFSSNTNNDYPYIDS